MKENIVSQNIPQSIEKPVTENNISKKNKEKFSKSNRLQENLVSEKSKICFDVKRRNFLSWFQGALHY